ncbi:MAG: CHAP domain-containing protein [Myxococcota bacterium]
MLLAWLLACAPSVHRMPGPLGGLGADAPGAAWTLPREARPARPAAPTRPAAPPTPLAIAEAAAAFVGNSALYVDGARYRFDCSGLVEASLASAGCAFRGSTEMLFQQAREHRVLHRKRLPTPGDVAFFDDTYDDNGNGRLDDPLTHVAVVESVDGKGTITLIHVGSKGVTRFLMNLRRPEDRHDADGNLINSYIRHRKAGDSPRTRYLAGELWVAFGSFWDADVQDATADRSTR